MPFLSLPFQIDRSDLGNIKGQSGIRISSNAAIIIGVTAGAAGLGLAGFVIYRYLRKGSRRKIESSQERLLPG
jgi:hypothetical protein